jgi:TM2 domain-containing membrane protein YozV
MTTPYTHHSPTGHQRQLSWIVTLLFSIFLGNLGIDRFMMGHIGLGLLKLITCGGLGIWWLVDVVLIATRHQFQNIEWID